MAFPTSTTTNLIVNPSFEDNASADWLQRIGVGSAIGNLGGTTTGTGVVSGSTAALTSATPAIPPARGSSAGTTYSSLVRSNQQLSVAAGTSVTISAYVTAAGTTNGSPVGTIGIGVNYVSAPVALSTTTPTLLSFVVSPSDNLTGPLIITANTSQMIVDAVMVVSGSTQYSYFDGSSNHCAWLGTPNHSVSQYVVNKNLSSSGMSSTSGDLNLVESAPVYMSAKGSSVTSGSAALGLYYPSGAMDDFTYTDIDQVDPRISYAYSYSVGADSAAWTRFWGTFTQPKSYQDGSGNLLWQRAAYGGAGVRFDAVPAGKGHFFDKVEFEHQPLSALGTAMPPSSYTPARQATIIIRANRVNLLSNGGLNADAYGYTTTGSAASTISWDGLVGHSVPGSLKTTIPVYGGAVSGLPWYGAKSESVTLVPGRTYTASVWTLRSDINPIPLYIGVPGIGIGWSSDTAIDQGDMDSNGWIRLRYTFKATVSSANVAVFVQDADQDNDTASVVFWADDWMLEEVDTPGDFFDGNTPGPDYLWEGTVNRSRSHYYENRRSKQYRLDDIIKSAVPIGLQYQVLFAQPPT